MSRIFVNHGGQLKFPYRHPHVESETFVYLQMSEAFEAKVEAAVAPGPNRTLAGVQLIAANKDGIQYDRIFGQTSVEPGAPPMTEDSAVWFASCTKLVTSLCVLQCVERGILTLDEDISRLVPEVKSIGVFKGFSDPETQKVPILEAPTTKITARMLLTHTSGFVYPLMFPELAAAATAGGADLGEGGTMNPYLKTPLYFEPGEGWSYGTSLDWAGLLVSRANDNLPLGDYMEANVFGPLGIKDIQFRPADNPDLERRLIPTTRRGTDGTLSTMRLQASTITLSAPEDMGGEGLFGTGHAFFRVLQAVLAEDPRILNSPASWDSLYNVEVHDPRAPFSIDVIFKEYSKTAAGSAGDGTATSIKWGHGLAGSLLLTDVPGWCRKNTLHWGGAHNNLWWVDRKSGLATFLNTQTLPFDDPSLVTIAGAFHGEMLRLYGGDAI